jgi:hypothetical protein
MCIDNNRYLKGIITGFAKGGTTLVNGILNNHPQICNGFETGLLYEDNLIDFLKKDSKQKINFFNILKISWDLTDQDIEYICSSQDWFQAYNRLKEKSPLTRDKNTFIIDKTPRYLNKLSKVLNKIPNIPCILVVRDPRSVVCSQLRSQLREFIGKDRSKITNFIKDSGRLRLLISDLCKNYNRSREKYLDAINNGYKDRILVIQYEKLCLNPEEECTKIFNFLNLDFNLSYLDLSEVKFKKNIHNSIVEKKYIYEYKNFFNDEICKFIIQKVNNCDEWIF